MMESSSGEQEQLCWDEQPAAVLDCPNRVYALCFTPDGKSLVTACEGRENNLQVWDVATETVNQTLKGHSDDVGCIAVTPNGRWVVSASDDNTIRVWSASTGQLLATVKKAHTCIVVCVVVTLDSRYIVSSGGFRDHDVHIWRITEKLSEKLNVCKVRSLKGHTGGVDGVAVSIPSKDGLHVVSGSYDKTVRLWDFESGRCICAFQDHLSGASSVAISSDKRHVFSGRYDKIRVWDTQSGKLVHTLEGHTNIRLSSCDRYLVSVNEEHTRVLDWRSGAELQTLTGHRNVESAESISISHENATASAVGKNNTIASAEGKDNTVRLWKLTNPTITTSADIPIQQPADPQALEAQPQAQMPPFFNNIDWQNRKDTVETLTSQILALELGTSGYGSKVGERFHAAMALQAQATALKNLPKEYLLYLESIPQHSLGLLQDNLGKVDDQLEDLQFGIAVQYNMLQLCTKQLSRFNVTPERQASAKSQQEQILEEMRVLRISIKLLRRERLQTIHHLRSVVAHFSTKTEDKDITSNNYGRLTEQLSVDEIDISDLTNFRHLTTVHAQTPIQRAKYQATREVVLKTFHIDHPAQSQAFCQELEIRNTVNRHHNILPVIGIVYDPTNMNKRYLMLPWCEYTLDQWLPTVKPSFAVKYSVITQIISAVEHLHLQGVVHKDLKPSNILIDSNNHVQVTDFGYSKEVVMQPPSQQSTVLVGTRAFRDPVLDDRRHATFDSDMYSLGLCIYSMFFPYGAEGHGHPQSIPPHPKKSLVDVLKALILSDYSVRPTLLVSKATTGKPLLSSFPLFTNFVTDLDTDLEHLLGPRDAVWKLTEDEAALPWKVEPDGIGRIKLNRKNRKSWEATALTGELKNEIFEQYVAGQVFNHQTIPSTLKNVTLVRKVESQAAFMEKIRTLSHRYGNLTSVIDIEKSLLTPTVQYIDMHYGILASSYPRVQLRQAYHGVASLEVAESILQGGFMVRCKTDNGWYGRGIYLAMDIDYARYYGNFVIVCNVASGHVFEITNPASHSNGKSIEPDYDTHAVVVNHHPSGLPQPIPKDLTQPPSSCHPQLSAELVVAEASQILPRCILDFS